MSELAAASGLPHKFRFFPDFPANGFAINDLKGIEDGVDTEFPLQPIANEL